MQLPDSEIVSVHKKTNKILWAVSRWFNSRVTGPLLHAIPCSCPLTFPVSLHCCNLIKAKMPKQPQSIYSMINYTYIFLWVLGWSQVGVTQGDGRESTDVNKKVFTATTVWKTVIVTGRQKFWQTVAAGVMSGWLYRLCSAAVRKNCSHGLQTGVWQGLIQSWKQLPLCFIFSAIKASNASQDAIKVHSKDRLHVTCFPKYITWVP